MAIVSKVKRGAQHLMAPYYLGAKTPTKQGGKLNSHYVMINPLVAARLGVKARSTHKPTDEFVGGAIFDKNRSYTAAGGKKEKTIAKRNITPGSKSVQLFTGNYVKNPKTKKDEEESYHVGFPSSLTMVDVIFYVNKQFPLVKFLRHGGRTYTSRKIEIPKSEKLVAEKAVEGK
jgi:hypothetical protein